MHDVGVYYLHHEFSSVVDTVAWHTLSFERVPCLVLPVVVSGWTCHWCYNNGWDAEVEPGLAQCTIIDMTPATTAIRPIHVWRESNWNELMQRNPNHIWYTPTPNQLDRKGNHRSNEWAFNAASDNSNPKKIKYRFRTTVWMFKTAMWKKFQMPRTTTPKPTIAWQTFKILCKVQDIATVTSLTWTDEYRRRKSIQPAKVG